MIDAATKQRVRELREKKLSPKEIARATGLRPVQVTELIHELANDGLTLAPKPQLIECVASLGFGVGLSPKDPAGPVEGLVPAVNGIPSLVQVGSVWETVPGTFELALFLVDTACLGVKNVVHKRKLNRADGRQLFSNISRDLGTEFLPISLATARELVFGAADYAASLGFPPHPDFERTRHLLGGPWQGPSVIQFGYNGKPFFVDGPDDDVSAILAQLDRSVGAGNYGFTTVVR